MRIHMRREQKGLIFLILIIVILVAISSVFYFSLRTDPIKENLKQDPILKILFVVEENGEALFSDVLIYYPESGKGVFVSVPGNTGAIYSSLGRVDRIDTIYKEKGILTYKSEIEKMLDADIPFYFVVSLSDFQRITDLFGGLEVFIPSPVDERSSDGDIWLLPGGTVNLDGDKIRTYMTYTIEGEDYEDVQERRQSAMVAFLAALNRNRTHMFAKNNIALVSKSFISNTDEKGLVELLRLVANIDSETITLLEVTGTSRNVDGQLLLFPFRNGDFIKEVVRRATTSIVSSNTSAGSRSYIIEIQNGTKVQGLAHNTQILLQGAGFEVLNISNAPSNDYEKTQIIDHIGNRDAARGVGDFIRCYTIIEEEILENEEDTSNVDFTLILGRDFDGRYVHGQSPEADNAPEASGDKSAESK